MAFDDVPQTSQPDGLPPGTVLGDTYEVVKQIALGGMAEVYRAKNIHTDEPVAVKVVLPEFARDETILALFKKEATILSRLHNDAIVHYHVFSVDRAMNRPFLVMEYVDGLPLSEVIRNTPMAPSRVRQVMLRIASGLSAAHQLGVVHRDLSPDNVILPGGDVSRTKIIDFGIAKAAAVGEGTLLGGKFAGKYNFVSPEQLGLFGGDITERSDIYSLGLVLAAALLGAPLDMSGSHFEVIEKRRTVPDLSRLDASLRPIVASMLEPDPNHRPPTMRSIVEMYSVAPGMPQQDTGTVFGGEMPPVPSDPWAATVIPHDRSVPPGPRSIPPSNRSIPPDSGSMPRTARSLPPISTGSEPTQFMPDPLQARSIPPEDRTSLAPAPPAPPAPREMPPERTGLDPSSRPAAGVSLAPVDVATLGGAESPFGPYDSNKRPANLPPIGKEKKRGSPIVAVAAVIALLVVGGGGFLAYQMHLFGGPASTPVVPSPGGDTAPPAPAPTTPTPSEKPVDVAPAGPGTASGPATVAPTPPVSPGPTVQPGAEPVTPVTPSAPDTIVASTGPSAGEKLGTAADRIAWLTSYPLDECQYAAPTTVADNSFNVEAFGTSAAPFNRMSDAFEKRSGFAPNINLHQINDPQCPAVDFLNSLKTASQPGPVLSLTDDNIENGSQLQGTLANTGGWSTELLVIDDQGNVYNVTGSMVAHGSDATFSLPVSLTGTPGSSAPLPTLIMAISSKTPIAAAHFTEAGTVWTTLRDIGKEINAKSIPVSISTNYFKLNPTPVAASAK